ncbi:hypothetical protein BC938DRAFT_476379 [Jimgerdemannia flammicorona]|uniref:Secreted protein n=1 Tax=Jimgerdemannia flammicorona TaxID=994334 RepID=A0A433PHI9_9FUNG|nr:hypothetical protein BC938DRAFT_476379 [Jimgerdemannia flammicorona]
MLRYLGSPFLSLYCLCFVLLMAISFVQSTGSHRASPARATGPRTGVIWKPSCGRAGYGSSARGTSALSDWKIVEQVKLNYPYFLALRMICLRRWIYVHLEIIYVDFFRVESSPLNQRHLRGSVCAMSLRPHR